jgi:hypothetical protein
MSMEFSNLEVQESDPAGEVLDAWLAVKQYNQHTYIARDKKEAEEDIKHVLSHIENVVTIDDVYRNHQPALNRAGIRLIPVSKHPEDTYEDDPPGFVAEVGSLPTFSQFVHKNFNSKNLTQGKIIFLKEISKSVNNDVESILNRNLQSFGEGNEKHLQKNDLTDRMIGMDNFIEEYKRLDPKNNLDLSSSVDTLALFNEHYKENSLLENLIGSKYTLTGVTPELTLRAYWDMPVSQEISFEQFREKWSEMITAMKYLKNHPDLFNEGLTNMLTATEDILARKKRWSDEPSLPYFDVVEEAYHKLKQLEFED